MKKAIKEANEVKNIYNLATVSAIYLQVRNRIYGYRLRRDLPILQRRLEKSVDGGYAWYFIPNTENIEDIRFIASIPYSQSKAVFVNIKMGYSKARFTNTHNFVALLRSKYYSESSQNYAIAATIRTVIQDGNNRYFRDHLQVIFSRNLDNLPNPIVYSLFRVVPDYNVFYKTIDSFINSYNLIFTISPYNPPSGYDTYMNIAKITRQSIYSPMSYEMVTSMSSYDPTYHLGRSPYLNAEEEADAIKAIVVGNYIYTVYSTMEIIYTPSANSSSSTHHYSIYLAYKKHIPNYWNTNISTPWVKRKIFSIAVPEYTGNLPIPIMRSVRMVYGQVGSNRFHVTFILERLIGAGTAVSRRDIYYLASPDGVNWSVVNIDDSLGQDNIYPLDVIPLFGDLNGTTNKLHMVYINATNPSDLMNSSLELAYTSTSNGVAFVAPQIWNTWSQNPPLYRNFIATSIQMRGYADMEAFIHNGQIHVVIVNRHVQFVLHIAGTNIIRTIYANLVYLVKGNFNQSAIFNAYLHPQYGLPGPAKFFKSVALCVLDQQNTTYVHIFMADVDRGLYYIRDTANGIIVSDLNSPSYGGITIMHSDRYIGSLDCAFKNEYIHVSYIMTNPPLIDSNGNRYFEMYNPNNLIKLGYTRIRTSNQVFVDLEISSYFANTNGSIHGDGVRMQDFLRLGSVYLNTLRQCLVLTDYLHIIAIKRAFYTYNGAPVHVGHPFVEVIHINPFSEPLNTMGSFDAKNIHPVDSNRLLHINGCDANAVTYVDTYRGNIKVILPNRSETQVIPYSTGVEASDIKVVNEYIYVAYAEAVRGRGDVVRLAISRDKGESWSILDFNAPRFGMVLPSRQEIREIAMEVKENLINIVYSSADSLSYTYLIKRVKHGPGQSFSEAYIPVTNFEAERIKTQLDNQNRLHILGRSEYRIHGFFYVIFDNNTNTFVDNGLGGLTLTSLPQYSQMFSRIGPEADIFVEPNGDVVIVAETWNPHNRTEVYLFKRSQGMWLPPVRVPFGPVQFQPGLVEGMNVRALKINRF
ncbi:MAG: hypothetical protein ABDH21_05980 [bacterium]